MLQLPEALAPLSVYEQFCLYLLAPRNDGSGKTDKFPCDFAGNVRDAHDPAIWVDAATALQAAQLYGPQYGAGFVFTSEDPFYFFDIDDCLLPDGSGWSERAVELMGRMSGAAVEVSQSGTGLHIIGTGTPSLPSGQRRKKATTGDFDLYTEARFCALTGANVVGSVSAVADQAQLDYIVSAFLSTPEGSTPGEWTDAPVPEWTGPEDDAELIERALASSSTASILGGKASFRDLWECNEEVLARVYPPDHTGQSDFAYDASTVDSALVAHLAFWTGKDCARIERLMWLSALVREKWEERPKYVEDTILRAVAVQSSVYSVSAETTLADQFGGVKLRGSDKQREYANSIRERKLAECGGDVDVMHRLCRIPTAKLWIENKDRPALEIDAMTQPIEHAADPMGDVETGPQLVSGFQYLPAEAQIDHFRGCFYVKQLDEVFTPDGYLMNRSQFNATYGGYEFQSTDDGQKSTKQAWDAFTQSQVVRWPLVDATCFRPNLPPGHVVVEEGKRLVNTYVPIDTPRKPGDPSPFLEHVRRLLPDERDRSILLAYMAALIQYPGIKFQWCPLIQGAQGNGKSLFSRCVAFAVGRHYSHMPRADEINEKFNDWLFGKLFIGIEDIYVPEKKREIIEVLKPMITSDWLAERAMQRGQVMRDLTANFILNSNHKNGVQKTQSDRRFAPFFTAQQKGEDFARDGLDGDYFPNLYEWLKGDGRYKHEGTGHGYAVVADFLATYAIPDELNPAGQCHRAPRTTSTDEAIQASMGPLEQAIHEATQEGRPGFAGGWVSSIALDQLMRDINKSGTSQTVRAEALDNLGYIKHPALREGRVNNALPGVDLGKKPRLYVLKGHLAANLTTGAEVAKAYQDAQAVGGPAPGSAEATFGNN